MCWEDSDLLSIEGAGVFRPERSYLQEEAAGKTQTQSLGTKAQFPSCCVGGWDLCRSKCDHAKPKASFSVIAAQPRKLAAAELLCIPPCASPLLPK